MRRWMSLAFMSRYAWICKAGVFSQRRRKSSVSGYVSEVLKCEVGFRGVTANEAGFRTNREWTRMNANHGKRERLTADARGCTQIGFVAKQESCLKFICV